MRPVLVLLNGLPGSGKSTLARAWCDEHATRLPLALDVDVLRSMLGGWTERPLEAGPRARALALAAIRTHLEAGRDVLVPQFLRRPEFADDLARVATDAGAGFLHCSLDIAPTVAAVRLAGRTSRAEGVLEQPLETLQAELEAFLASRPEVVRLRSDGDAEAGLDALVSDLRGTPAAGVRLVVPDESLLAGLLGVALTEATADEVTPQIGPDAGWTGERIEWFLGYHRERRGGLSGPLREATWAVVLDGAPVGAVRLRSLGRARVETGMWLARSARGRGNGAAALAAVLDEAGRSGSTTIVADTAAGNAAAQALLLGAGFTLRPDGDRVRATLDLHR